jgi:hypothetical protein
MQSLSMGLMCSSRTTYMIEVDATYKTPANNYICQSLDTCKVKVSESESISYITFICLERLPAQANA